MHLAVNAELHLQPNLLQGGRCQQTRAEAGLGFPSVSALPRKPLGTHSLQRDTPAQRHPLETATEAMQAHLKEHEKSQINNLTDHLEGLENKKQIKPKVSRDFEKELYLVLLLDQYIFEAIFELHKFEKYILFLLLVPASTSLCRNAVYIA